MTTNKKLITAAGVIAISLLSHSAMSMDAAELFKERTCIACHGDKGRVPIMDEYPKLAGQTEIYLLTQMKDIKSGARTNAHAVAMTNVMHMISDEEMATIAKWLTSLPE